MKNIIKILFLLLSVNLSFAQKDKTRGFGSSQKNIPQSNIRGLGDSLAKKANIYTTVQNLTFQGNGFSWKINGNSFGAVFPLHLYATKTELNQRIHKDSLSVSGVFTDLGKLSLPNNWNGINTFNSSIGFKSENSLTGHYSNYTLSNDGNFADGSLLLNANKFTGGAVVSTPVLRINNDKVGIGVSYDNQAEKLAVNGTTVLKEVSVTNDIININNYTKLRSFIDGTGNDGKYVSYFDRFNGSSVSSSPTFVINQTGVNIGSILDPTEKLNVSGNVNVAGSLIVSGTSGNGFVSFTPQSSSPTSPTSGFRLFANSTGLFSWIGSNGFRRTFDASSITQNVTWTMKNQSGTVPLENTINNYSANQIFNANVGIGTVNPISKLQISNVLANTIAMNINANNTTSQSFGVRMYAGTNSSDYALSIINAADTQNLFFVRGDGNVGIGPNSPLSRLHITGGDARIEGSSNGLLLQSPNGLYWRVQVNNSGVLTVTQL